MAGDGHGAIEGTPIEDDLRKRILRACSAMPYSARPALMRIQSIGTAGRSGCTLEALADWLEAMAEVLRDHEARCAIRDEELRAQARDIRAATRLVDRVLSESEVVSRFLALAGHVRDEVDGIPEGT